jgi:hypothetical protein
MDEKLIKEVEDAVKRLLEKLAKLEWAMELTKDDRFWEWYNNRKER